MQVQNINNTNFNGIKLSSNKFEKVREVAFYLHKTGFTNLGHKKVFCNNTLNDKIKYVQNIRNLAKLQDREFGAVFLPWSKEAYIIAKPEYEQLMINAVKHCDEGAVINLAI